MCACNQAPSVSTCVGFLMGGRLSDPSVSWISFYSSEWRSSDSRCGAEFIGIDGGDGMHFAWSTCLCGFSCRSVPNASWIPLQKHQRRKWPVYNCLTFGIRQADEINRQRIRLVPFATNCSTNFASFVCPDPGNIGGLNVRGLVSVFL